MRYFLLAILAGLLFIPFLGHVHLFDWDEINFAEAAREMIVTGHYSRVQIDFQPFWEKPPFFIWMQAISMHLFGVNEFAARFPNAVVGIVTILLLLAIGKKLVNEKFGTWWALLYAASWLPHFYFKSGIIDPSFNLFIFLAIYFVFRIPYSSRSLQQAILAGIFLGLAVLTKGPVAILVSVLVLVVYWLYNRLKVGIRWPHLLLIALFAFLTTFSWFGYEIIKNGWWFVHEFISYQVRLFSTEDAGHGGPFFYHWVVLLIGCFPASVFLFTYFQTARSQSIYQYQTLEVRDFRNWMWILFWVVLLLFSIVKTKIVHYSSLCYFPLSFLAANQVYRLLENKLQFKKWNIAILGVLGAILALAITALPLIGLYKKQIIPYVADPFAVGNLQAQVPWVWWECLIGITYLLVILTVVILFLRQQIEKGFVTLVVAQLIVIQIALLHFVPKVEAYSQRAAIEFYQSFQGEDVYVQVLGFKSYAHLFYTRKQPPMNPNYYNKEWLLKGPVDKPTYFVCKNIAAAAYIKDPHLQVIGEKNGFVFFKRK